MILTVLRCLKCGKPLPAVTKVMNDIPLHDKMPKVEKENTTFVCERCGTIMKADGNNLRHATEVEIQTFVTDMQKAAQKGVRIVDHRGKKTWRS